MRTLLNRSDQYGYLISINPVENIYVDRIYLASVIEKLYGITNNILYVEAGFINDEDESSKLLADLHETGIELIDIDANTYHVIFRCHAINESLLNVLSKIWFAYQHVGFSFFTEDIVHYPKRKSWVEIVNNYKSFVMFKDAQDYIVWIGKSENLDFDPDSLL